MYKTIIIADDHPMTADGMERLFTDFPRVKVIGKTYNGIDAIALIKNLKPDCALIDLSMPGANGSEVFLEAKRWSPKTKFVIITGVSAAGLFGQLYKAGIDGLFVKNVDPEIIQDGIIRILAGERVFCETSIQAIDAAEQSQDLSKRELEVLHALAKGHNNREIAQILGVSPKTVDSHRTNLLRKMKVNSTASLLVLAMRQGLLDTLL